ARVATGALDGTFAAPNSHDWDLAGADLLVHEAGGLVTTVTGESLIYNRPIRSMARWWLPGAPVTRGCSASFAIGLPNLRDRAFSGANRIRFAKAMVPVEGNRGLQPMSDQVQRGQLLHLVFGGELIDLDNVEFRNLDKLDIVGIYPNYAAAYAAWKAKAQQTVDNAHMRYFIVHLHRLLDPKTDQRAKRCRQPGP